MRLYSFFNSSTSYRVRIALALKGVDCEIVPVNIRKGEHRAPNFHGQINVSAAVPVLEVDGKRIAQSLAIIEYLDTAIPTPRLIPAEALARAEVLGLADIIACDMHPLNNPRVLRYLQDSLGVSDADKDGWYQHWIHEGFSGSAHTRASSSAGGQEGRLPLPPGRCTNISSCTSSSPALAPMLWKQIIEYCVDAVSVPALVASTAGAGYRE